MIKPIKYKPCDAYKQAVAGAIYLRASCVYCLWDLFPGDFPVCFLRVMYCITNLMHLTTS